MSQYPQASLPGLPTELRLQILELALKDARIEIRRQRKSARLNRLIPATFLPRLHTKTAWSLLHLNSQIRRESQPLFYSLGDFHIYVKNIPREKFVMFLETIGTEAIKLIRTMFFHTRDRCTMYRLEKNPFLPPDDSNYCLRNPEICLVPKEWLSENEDVTLPIPRSTFPPPSSEDTYCDCSELVNRLETTKHFKGMDTYGNRIGRDARPLTAEHVLNVWDFMQKPKYG
ncbi:unnamed protein product [Cercospora beticola]|nr:unnamed protein product [Cercospora beticola]